MIDMLGYSSFRDTDQVYDMVWEAKEGDFRYDRLAISARKHMPSLEK